MRAINARGRRKCQIITPYPGRDGVFDLWQVDLSSQSETRDRPHGGLLQASAAASNIERFTSWADRTSSIRSALAQTHPRRIGRSRTLVPVAA